MKKKTGKNYKYETYKYFTTTIAVVVPIAVIFVFILFKSGENSKEKILQQIAGNADISLNKIHHIATREGKKEWILDSESVRFNASNQKAELEKISMTFFLQNKDVAQLIADRGILYQNTNNIELFGNIIINKDEYNIKTERLVYEHENKSVIINSLVEISNGNFFLKANSMALDINKGIVEFEGGIDALF